MSLDRGYPAMTKTRILSLFLIFIILLTGCDTYTTPKSGNVEIKYNPEFDDGIARVKWDGSLFEESPDLFNSDLAHTCAGIAAAANDAGDHTGEAQYIVPALKKSLRFKDICLYNYENYTGSDAHKMTDKGGDCAFSIGHQKMSNSDGEFELVIIVCRGTETFNEAIDNDFFSNINPSKDGRWSPYKTYDGYVKFADQVFAARNSYYQKYGDSFANNIKYLLIGHSLGGAAVQLVAARLTDQGQCIYACTFGALNAIDQPATEYHNIWNIFNYYDTYGPHGAYISMFKPTGGADTWDNKLGRVFVFTKDYGGLLKKLGMYNNHIMASYYQAMQSGLLNQYDEISSSSTPTATAGAGGNSASDAPFVLEGTSWKQTYGAGTWESYNGRTIKFSKDGHCALWSPYDTYEVLNMTEDSFDLSITGLIGGNPIYHVKIVDDSTLELYLSELTFVLERK